MQREPKEAETTTPPMTANADAVAAVLDAETAAAIEAEHAATTTCRDAAEWLAEPDEPDDPVVHDLIESGEMIAVVGQSKAGKSFIAAQLGTCVATGNPFLGRATERRRVYIANLEVSRKQYKRRLRMLCDALNIAPDDLRGWLFVDNMKGETATWDRCREEAIRHGCAVVIIDPFYQIFHGDESDVAAVNDAVAEMKKYQQAGLTTIIVYHSPKGFSGDRQLIDMISGSSTLARFPEAIIGLLNHARNKQCRVVKFVLRNYAPPDDATIKFDNGMFTPADDIAPVVETANNRTSQTAQYTAEEIANAVNDVLHNIGQPTPKGALIIKVQDACAQSKDFHPGEKKVAGVVELMVNQGVLRMTDRQNKKGGCKLVGLPEHFPANAEGER